MVVAMSSAALINLLYIRFLGQKLSDDDLGVFFTAQSVLLIFGAAGGALQVSIAGGAAHLGAAGGVHALAGFAGSWFRRISVASLLVFAAFAVFSVPASRFLHLGSPITFAAMGLAAALYAFIPVLNGMFQGMQSFWMCAALHVADVGLRLCWALLFHRLGILDATGAIATLPCTFVVLSVLFGPLLARSLGGGRAPAQAGPAAVRRGDLPAVTASLISLSCFSYFDMLVVQKFFGGGPLLQELIRGTGVYGAAAYIGRSFMFIAAPLVMVMFPKARDCESRGAPSWHLLRRSLASVAVVCLPLAAFCWFFAEEVSAVLFPSVGAAELVRMYVIAILPYVFLTVFVHYCLAVGERWISRVLPLAAGAQLAVYAVFHSSYPEVILVLGVTGFMLLLPVAAVSIAGALRREGWKKPA